MSKHWVVRIQKPSLNAILAIVVGGTTTVCGWWLVKCLFVKFTKKEPISDEIKCKATTIGSPNASQSRMDDTVSTRSQTIALSNHRSYGRVLSLHNSASSVSTLAVDCGTIGLQTLNKVVDQVEDCINKINRTVQQLNTKDQSAEVFINELQKFLEASILLREQFKRAFIQETPISASDLQCIDSFSDIDNESFYSTVEEIDFSELELHILSNFHRPLYRNALKEINEASPACRYLHYYNIRSKLLIDSFPNLGYIYRIIRTGLMLCSSDIEYIGKLICIRRGFDYILSKDEPVSWFIQSGKAVACGLLINLGCATLDFENAFS